MSTVLASAADARYGKWLVNLVGSVQRRSPLFDALVVYDLGLTPFQRFLLEHARGVDVRAVPAFVPHWRQGFTWKPWIWTHLEADTIVWLDAGTTVLRPLEEMLQQTRDRGYFVVSQGVRAGDSTPRDYYDMYGLAPTFADRISIAAGILAFRPQSDFYTSVVKPTFDDVVVGRSLGFSPTEAAKLNRGLGEVENLMIRDCPQFRWDQTLFTIHFYRSMPDGFVNDLYKFAGFRSPRDHAEQVIWSHRRRGDYRFLPRVRYAARAASAVGLAWGASVFARHWALSHRWALRPGLYATLGRRLITTGQLRSRRSDRSRSSPT